MIVKTKKYKLDTTQYIKMALARVLKEQWWVVLIALAIAAGYFWIPSWWWISMAILAYVLYVLFWLIQFAGVTQMEQNKVMFDKLSYEIDSRQIMIKLNAKQGMPVKLVNDQRSGTSKRCIFDDHVKGSIYLFAF
jgi:membrane protein YdbS with pleckstrin-like domain